MHVKYAIFVRNRSYLPALRVETQYKYINKKKTYLLFCFLNIFLIVLKFDQVVNEIMTCRFVEPTHFYFIIILLFEIYKIKLNILKFKALQYSDQIDHGYVV